MEGRTILDICLGVKGLADAPKAGELKVIERKGRKITMQATGKKGFGAWRIIKNEPARK